MIAISLRKSLDYNATIKMPDTDMLRQLLQNPQEVITQNKPDTNTEEFTLSVPYSIIIYNVENGFVLDVHYPLENIHKFYIANSISDLFNIISGIWDKEKDKNNI